MKPVEIIAIILLAIIAFVSLYFFLTFQSILIGLHDLFKEQNTNGIDQKGWLDCVGTSKTVAECDKEFLH